MRIRYESAYGRSLSHAERKDHKYAYKKMVNGKWRYYYDDDNVPDKGLSYKKMENWKMENNIGISAPGIKPINKKTTTYSLRIKGVKGYQEVPKDVWDNAGTGLYYKNEPVGNIAKRKVDEAKDAASKSIKKAGSKVSEISREAVDSGKKFVNDLFDRKRKKR